MAWGLLVLVIVALAGSALSNLLLPSHSEVLDRLSDLDRPALEEAFHLRRQLGDQLGPGGGGEIPLILYNEEQAFLVGCREPSPGWNTVTSRCPPRRRVAVRSLRRGGGQPYYRQRLPDDGATPQAFTVRIGGMGRQHDHEELDIVWETKSR